MSDWARAIVRVWRGKSTEGGKYRGTAFLVAANQLITAKHVVQQNGTTLPNTELFLYGPAWTGVRCIGEISPHNECDIALLTLPREDDSTGELIQTEQGGLNVGDTVTVAGYVSEDSDLDCPQVTIKRYQGQYHQFVLHTYVASGQSGGPALRDGRLVGVVIAKHTDLNSSYIIPLDAFRELLPPGDDSAVESRQAGSAKPDGGPEQQPFTEFPGEACKALARDKLIHLFSSGTLDAVMQIFLGHDLKRDKRADAVAAADKLIAQDTLQAVRDWTRAATSLYDQCKAVGDVPEKLWQPIESVYLQLLPLLVDIDRLKRFDGLPDDVLLFLAPFEYRPPNRLVELLFVRLRPNFAVEFESWGHKSAVDNAQPSNAVDVSKNPFSDPNIDSVVERIGQHLLTECFGEDAPDTMDDEAWRDLDDSLLMGRDGKLNFYIVIPGDNRCATPAILARIYRRMPNLVKFLMTKDAYAEIPFTCSPGRINKAIVTFWDLKAKWLNYAAQ